MLPKSGSNQYAYNFADLLVQVELGREFDTSIDYSFMVYSASLRLMVAESTWNPQHQVQRSDSTLSMAMHNHSLWMPGKYFFLLATKDAGCVIRFDLELDDKCRFTVGEPRRCDPLSDEDILAHQVLEAATLWNGLCDEAGNGQLKRKTLEWLKRNAASTNGDNPDYNLIVSRDGSVGIDWYPLDWSHHVAYRSIAKMLIMCVPGLKLRIGDCAELVKPEMKNPYRLWNVFFDKENPLFDDTFDMEDHVDYWLWNSPYRNDNQPATYVYVLYNAIILDDEALKRLHEVMREPLHYVVFCDNLATIDTVIDCEPSILGYYPEENRIALEDALPEEVIRRVFSSSKLCGIRLTPAAVEKLCRLLMTESSQRRLGYSASYAERLSEIAAASEWNSNDETIIVAGDIDPDDFLS